MKITIPENIGEITLGQYQDYDTLLSRTDLTQQEAILRTVKIFTKVSVAIAKEMSLDDMDDVVKLIDKALNTEAPFQQRFKIGSVEFGFIPNFDKLKAKEYFDLSGYKDNIEDLNKLMAVLYRPISNQDKFGNYSIMEYQGTDEWAEVMKQTPLSIVNGALDFFLHLSKICTLYTQKYLVEERAKEQQQESTLKSGDGLQH